MSIIDVLNRIQYKCNPITCSRIANPNGISLVASSPCSFFVSLPRFYLFSFVVAVQFRAIEYQERKTNIYGFL